jgi:curli biogenesis system outer membrane secretion channel CsgG
MADIRADRDETIRNNRSCCSSKAQTRAAGFGDKKSNPNSALRRERPSAFSEVMVIGSFWRAEIKARKTGGGTDERMVYGVLRRAGFSLKRVHLSMRVREEILMVAEEWTSVASAIEQAV